jgi:arabinogalactan endo-1,4-beta-galactosidase
MLWPDGRTDTPEHWANLARLIKSAIRGIRESSGDPMPKIVIHIDRGDQKGVVRWFFDHLRAQQVEFDVIGLSYYPDKTSKLSNLQASVDDAAERYGCPILIAETAFPAIGREPGVEATIDGIEVSTAGQAKFAQTLCVLLKKIPQDRGLGVSWWGAEYQPLSGFRLGGYDRSSMFDPDGNMRPVADELGRAAIK